MNAKVTSVQTGHVDFQLVNPPTCVRVDSRLDPLDAMMERLPQWTWLHIFLSYLTGKVSKGQVLPAGSRVWLVSRTVAFWLLGIAIGFAVGPYPQLWYWFPIAWILQVHGARTIQLVFYSSGRPRHVCGPLI